MELVVLATDGQWAELTAGTEGLQWKRAAVPFSFAAYPAAAAFFLLHDFENADYAQTAQPVFVNSVTLTLRDMAAPKNVVRINGWNTFLKRTLWEIAGTNTEAATALLHHIGKTAVAVNDEPGFIAAKVVGMIINEAYFALGDAVSDKAAIDTAMKLGTNYPYGPFEWAEKAGVRNIYNLLQKLSGADKRYAPAPALIKEATALTDELYT